MSPATLRAITAGEPVELPAAWHALPEDLRKPFWTVEECERATGLSRSTLNREWSDPRSTFPKRRRVGRRVHVPAIEVLRHMEA